MAMNVRRMHCDADAVFEVLANGWVYPSWVVGASRMRDVDENWPEPGSRLLHSVGVWPMLLDDTTTVEVWDPPKRMILTARGWPLGEARVTIEAQARGDECVVRILEDPTRGPAILVPRAIRRALLGWRNAETLHRLAYLAEGRRPGPSTADRETSDDSQGWA